MRRRVIVSIVCALTFFASAARAQEFPSGTVRLLVPFAAGGPTDIRAAVASPAFAERTRALGINAWGATPKELDAGFAKETAKWAEIAKAANLKAE